ncbi:hypothetical protein m4_igs_794 [Acanthamoeba polyphaga mimivirus]|nr:hypothetical protein m4_igs_794 [Acanthamoeba polyphaga mimivirus]
MLILKWLNPIIKEKNAKNILELMKQLIHIFLTNTKSNTIFYSMENQK